MARTTRQRGIPRILIYAPLEAIVILFWSFLYFEGANQALNNGATGIYEIQLNTSFVLAGFGIAATVLVTENRRKLFIVPTIIFLVAGLLMFANLVVPEYHSINYTTANPTQKDIFNFVVATGALGSFIFFSALASLIANLVRWYFEEPNITSRALVEAPVK